jgi:hypothetical protein
MPAYFYRSFAPNSSVLKTYLLIRIRSYSSYSNMGGFLMNGFEYHCKACHGVSPKAKNCGTKGCKLEGKPLKKRKAK